MKKTRKIFFSFISDRILRVVVSFASMTRRLGQGPFGNRPLPRFRRVPDDTGLTLLRLPPRFRKRKGETGMNTTKIRCEKLFQKLFRNALLFSNSLSVFKNISKI